MELAGDGFATQPDKARYESIVTQVDAALGAAGTALLDVSLSTREYSPTVQRSPSSQVERSGAC